jgi:predicted transposase/invertase (TIGR01784 family)
LKAKYINPFTDFGFKKIFGEPASKPLLIDFLNSLIPEANIVDLTMIDKEKLGKTDLDRKAIFDLYCENQNGEKIIVELQKAKQNYFKDRSVYYSTFPIQEQALKGDWNYKLSPVYCIGILDFVFENNDTKEVVHTIQLKNQNNQDFYDKLKFIYVEMPNFNKRENELVTRLDKWLFFIKNLEDFQSVPMAIKDAIFNDAFTKAEIANFDKTEQNNYEQSLKTYRDWIGVIDTAFVDGELLGRDEKGNEVAIKLIQKGFDNATIIEITELTHQKIEQLRSELNIKK